jgi:hypothetical protein
VETGGVIRFARLTHLPPTDRFAIVFPHGGRALAAGAARTPPPMGADRRQSRQVGARATPPVPDRGRVTARLLLDRPSRHVVSVFQARPAPETRGLAQKDRKELPARSPPRRIGRWPRALSLRRGGRLDWRRISPPGPLIFLWKRAVEREHKSENPLPWGEGSGRRPQPDARAPIHQGFKAWPHPGRMRACAPSKRSERPLGVGRRPR